MSISLGHRHIAATVKTVTMANKTRSGSASAMGDVSKRGNSGKCVGSPGDTLVLLSL